MIKLRKFVKSNIKLVIGIIIGLAIATCGTFAATVISSSNVGYTDTYSLGSTTVQGAIKQQLTNHNALFLKILYMKSY